jgi:hypothetical protein
MKAFNSSTEVELQTSPQSKQANASSENFVPLVSENDQNFMPDGLKTGA